MLYKQPRLRAALGDNADERHDAPFSGLFKWTGPQGWFAMLALPTWYSPGCRVVVTFHSENCQIHAQERVVSVGGNSCVSTNGTASFPLDWLMPVNETLPLFVNGVQWTLVDDE